MALIEKEPLLQAWCSDCPQVGHCMKTCEDYELIDAQPTVTAEPKRGYWIECDYKHLEHGMLETEPNAGLCCSVCRTGFKKSKMTYKQYCSACGARMDAEPPESEATQNDR